MSLGSRRFVAPARLVAVISIALLAAALPATTFAGGAAPANDNFAGATVVTPGSLPYTNTVDPFSATVEGAEVQTSCDGDLDKTVWYRITPSSNMTLQADTIGSDYNTKVDVFRGTTLANLNEVDCNFDIDFNNDDLRTSRVNFKATGGQAHYIRVSAEDDGGHLLVFHLRRVTPPSNDNYGNATAISSLPYSTNADITNATIQPTEPLVGDCDAARATRWYKFKPSTNMVIWANTFVPVDNDTVLAVYTGSQPGSAQQVACNDDTWISGDETYASSVTFKAKAGVSYRFQVGGYYGESGEHNRVPFEVRQVTPEANDDFANAFNIANPSTFEDAVNLRRTTKEASEPNGEGCLEEAANTAWYRHTASSVIGLRARTVDSNFDSEVAVYRQTGSGFGGLTLIGCSSQVDFATEAAATYYFQVGAEDGETAPVSFLLTQP